jgi:hypothetical protein
MPMSQSWQNDWDPVPDTLLLGREQVDPTAPQDANHAEAQPPRLRQSRAG